MSPEQGPQRSYVDAKDAIDTVLEAERETVDAIAACEVRASDIVEAARETARQIARRTDRRIAAVHSDRESGLPSPSAAPARSDETRMTEAETAALLAAADRVAEILTTPSTDDGTA